MFASGRSHGEEAPSNPVAKTDETQTATTPESDATPKKDASTKTEEAGSNAAKPVPSIKRFIEADLFEQGVAQYRGENYEESIVLFQKAYSADPSNPEISFYLGLANREILDFKEAVRHMRRVLSLDSGRIAAHFYIAEALYNEGNLEEALNESRLAEKADSVGAENYLLQGQIFTRMKRTEEALKAFEMARAITRNPEIRPQAEFSVATALFTSKNYEKAVDAFTDITIVYPDSDWAQFAHDYLATLETLVPPRARLTVTAGVSYDDNVLASPVDSTLVDAAKQGGLKKNLSLMTEFNLQRNDKMSTRAFYSFNSSQYLKPNFERSGGVKTFSQDTLSHTLSLLSTYNISAKSMLSLLASFNNTSLDYMEYSDSFTLMPSYTAAVTENQFAQIYVKGKKIEQDAKFYSQKFSQGLAPVDDRDAWEISAGGGYTYVLMRGALLSAKLEGVYVGAQGDNWDLTGVRAGAGASYELIKDALKANAYLDLYEQMYSNVNSSFGKKQTDTEINFTPSLEYVIDRTWSINLSYGLTYNISNIDVYNYVKNLVSVNAEFRY